MFTNGLVNQYELPDHDQLHLTFWRLGEGGNHKNTLHKLRNTFIRPFLDSRQESKMNLTLSKFLYTLTLSEEHRGNHKPVEPSPLTEPINYTVSIHGPHHDSKRTS